MSLALNVVSFENFRNHGSLRLEGLGNLTILIGPNGSGKTNILEGINLLTSASSFRHPLIEQMIKDGCDEAQLHASSAGDGRALETDIILEKGKKKVIINGKMKSTADMKGLLPSVTFVPDDIDLAKKSSSVKRNALDELGCQLSRNYYIVSRDYQKTVRYKNRLLKDEASDLMLDSIDETLATCGAQLFYYRKELFKRMIPVVAANYGRISAAQEDFSADYLPSWEHVFSVEEAGEGLKDLSRDEIKKALEGSLIRARKEEVARGRSLIGPHNDKIGFFLSGRAASEFASQGQQRSIVLAWKMGEVDIIRQSLGVYPILLLDDVMSELDADRRSLLVELVRQDVQTFITATDLSYFPDDVVEKAQVIELPLTR